MVWKYLGLPKVSLLLLSERFLVFRTQLSGTDTTVRQTIESFNFGLKASTVRGLQYSSDGYISATVILTFWEASPGARLWEQINATLRPDRLRADPFLHILHNQAQFIRHLCELPFQTWIPCTPAATFPVR
jgi:hypothetical protein